MNHPGIADAAVIGVHDQDDKEVPKAFVVRAPSSRLTAKQVTSYVAGQVAPYKKVRVVEFIESAPKALPVGSCAASSATADRRGIPTAVAARTGCRLAPADRARARFA